MDQLYPYLFRSVEEEDIIKYCFDDSDALMEGSQLCEERDATVEIYRIDHHGKWVLIGKHTPLQ